MEEVILLFFISLLQKGTEDNNGLGCTVDVSVYVSVQREEERER